MAERAITIIGAGIAGLSTAIRLAPLPVTVVVGAPLGEGSATAWAQGGIAAAMGEDDAASLHADDTVAAGAGLVDAARALHLAQNAGSQVKWLQSLGVDFDLDDKARLVLGREAAHGKNRIAHAGGDSTGAAVMRALIRIARETPSITFLPGWRAEDVYLEEGRVAGVKLVSDTKRVLLPSSAVILATGGIGQLYACTTNPGAACGDGIAMAARAGAELADLEFVQFHPTALNIGRDPMPLLTEALRGDGAILVNNQSKRFMLEEHKLAELAPRDVVARAIWRQAQEGLKPMLDARECFANKVNDKFPVIREICLAANIDPAHEALPVAPAAHYHMGGVVVDEAGQSSVPGLLACGEVGCAFIHGANRLASNSLLEALVYSENIASSLKGLPTTIAVPREIGDAPKPSREEEERLRVELRTLMYDRMGLVREEEGMLAALRRLAEMNKSAPVGSRLGSHILVAAMMTVSALERKESRGAHYRLDFPTMDAEAKHSRITLQQFEQSFARLARTSWNAESRAA